MNVLFLSHWFPYPPDNGSKLRIYNLLRQLGQRHQVTLVTCGSDEDARRESALRVLQAHCAAVRVVPVEAYRPASPKALMGYVSPQPRFLWSTHSQQLSDAVDAELARSRPDVVIASQLPMAPYALALRDVPAVLEELELSVYLDAVGQASGLRRLRAGLTWLKLRAYLRRELPRFRACTVVSAVEREHVLRLAAPSVRVEVVPNAVDVASYDAPLTAGPAPSPATLIFPGALTYRANFDAVQYFLERIYPFVRSAAPDTLFRVTGSTSGVNLGILPDSEAVQFTGHVPDVRRLIAQSWATVVPLRIGGGTRLKILESMAIGTPVVSTSKGAEGLDVTDGQDILIADDPYEFAQRVSELFRSPELRARLAANGRRLVVAKYDWSVAG